MSPIESPPTKQRNAGSGAGRNADSPWQMPLAAWKQVGLRTVKQSGADNVGLVAAAVAFYGFLALAPLLGVIVLTYGLVADPQTVLSNVRSLTRLVPGDAAQLIGDMLKSIVQTSGTKKGIGLFIAIAIAIFGARNAAGSLITALNIAYEEKETRGFLELNLLSLAITASGVALAAVALLAITALGYLEKLLPGTSVIIVGGGKILSYVLLVLGAAAAAATLYRYGPDRRKAKWEWITPGSMFAAIAWLVLTLGFGFYVAHFGNYGKTYGSIATIVVLVTWMYLSSYVLLFGAELNAELEHQTAKDTTEGAAKPMGERGAWAADHVAASDEPSKPGSEEDANGAEPADDSREPPTRAAASTGPDQPSRAREYATARVTSRAGSFAGLRKVGIVSTVLSTLGLSLLRKRGRETAGAAMLAAAAGLSLLKRDKEPQKG